MARSDISTKLPSARRQTVGGRCGEMGVLFAVSVGAGDGGELSEMSKPSSLTWV